MNTHPIQKHLMLLLAACAFLAACEREAPSTQDNPDAALAGCPALASQSNMPSDPASINGLSISGNCLQVGVSYGGGCANHRLQLVWDGVILESFPPQVNVRLRHDSNGDLCKALISTTLSRSLHPIEDPAYSSIVVNVIDTQGNSSAITYNY